VIWKNIRPKQPCKKFESIKIEAEDFDWENIPDLPIHKSFLKSNRRLGR
jgi:hypothetical protein